MIVYGRRATALKTQVLFEPCPNCKTTNSVHLTVYGRYAHIFWVPFFPIGKTGISVCSNCRQVLKLKEMPPELRYAYENIKTGAKTPIWYFSGLALIGIAIVFATVSDRQKGEKVGKMISGPKAGDIYEIELKDNAYTLYRVEKVDKDTVYVISNQYQTDSETGVSDLYLKPFDSSVVYRFPKATLMKMHNDDKIIDVTRK